MHSQLQQQVAVSGFPAVVRPAVVRPAVVRPAASRPAAVRPAASRATRLRLTRRGRFVITALAATPLVLVAFFGALGGGGAEATVSESANDFSYVTVEAGQSLWQLAEALAPSKDPRDVIAQIVRLNGLDGGVIHPGDRLAVPATYVR